MFVTLYSFVLFLRTIQQVLIGGSFQKVPEENFSSFRANDRVEAGL